MRTIVVPKINIHGLWDTPRERNGEIYRLMRYTFLLKYKGKMLLHNVVTGQLVELDIEEVRLLDTLPAPYSQLMDSLIESYFLVPNCAEEHRKVDGLRNLLRKLEDAKQKPGINSYTILPTTACNARCYYCFEKGIRQMTMNKQTADKLSEFICTHSGKEKKVYITWFGGEPTIAADRIDQICQRLERTGVQYQSKVISNGYLLDERMAQRAKDVWHTTWTQISVDGIENTYNRIKSYVNADDNPYWKVIRNIGSLIDQGIHVDIRMNYNRDTYQEFEHLVEDIYERYHDNPLVSVRAHQINSNTAQEEEWFSEQNEKLNEISDRKGLFRKPIELPCLDYSWCDAARSDTITVLPNGKFVRCPEMLEDDQTFGDAEQGIKNVELSQAWRKFAKLDRCKACVFFPACALIVGCPGSIRCVSKLEHIRRCKEAICQYVDQEADSSKPKEE